MAINTENNLLIEPVARLIEEFGRLPGIGPKSASRLTFFLLRADAEQSRNLAEALLHFKEPVHFCKRCYYITQADYCSICSNTGRDQRIVCVVEEPLDAVAIERTGVFKGVYHVLHGRIAPLEGMNREDIYFDQLVDRVRIEPIEEVILATNPNLEGEAIWNGPIQAPLAQHLKGAGSCNSASRTAQTIPALCAIRIQSHFPWLALQLSR
jgi:recombination protein RecR